MKLTLDALQVLDAIDRRGSFAAAAASLSRVPSSVSYTVQKLEQDLGVTLFQKQGRRAALTNAGRLLLTEGRDLLAAAERLALNTQQAATGWEPRLRIAVDHCVPDALLLNALAALYEAAPGTQVNISEEVLGGTWEALLEDRADLLVGAVDPVPGHRGLRHLPWIALPFVFAAHRDHPICNAPRPLARDDIRRHRLVTVADSARHQPAISRGITGQENIIQVATMQQKLATQLQGLGIGTLPVHLAQPHLDSGELVALPLAEPLRQTPCHLAWKTANRGRALRLVADALQAAGDTVPGVASSAASSTESSATPGAATDTAG